jgi:hypothetical protein
MESVRNVGYLFAGWILFGFAMSGLVSLSSGEPSGLIPGAMAAGGFVWLVRSYRRGGGTAGRPVSFFHELRTQLDRLGERLPEDPLESAAIVNAWSVHVGDPEASERLRRTYETVRRTFGDVQVELADTSATGAEERHRRLAAKLAHVEDYVRSVDLLAAHEPELLEDAIAEHAEAAESIDLARRTGADVEALIAADAKLQGARAALRRNEERPLDAIRLAEEAERIAAVAARQGALPSEVDAVRDRLGGAEEGLAAAMLRHAQSALAEVRGLPALAREQLERAATGDAAGVTAARATVQRIESHLADLERAAARARPTLEAAEQAVDAAAARGGAAASRAADLTSTARAMLRDDRPDWLEISALAERALLLLGEESQPLQDAGSASERARYARDDVWSWALTSAPDAEAVRAVAEQIDRLLDEAKRLEEAGDATGATAAYLRMVALAEPAVEMASRSRVKRAS